MRMSSVSEEVRVVGCGLVWFSVEQQYQYWVVVAVAR